MSKQKRKRSRPGKSTRGRDALQGAAGVASGLATGASAAVAVPVVGWIVGGALAAAAGTVALVGGIKQRRVTKSQALRWARKMKLPRDDANDVAGFVIRLARKDAAWRRRQKMLLHRRLQRLRTSLRKWRRRPGGRRTLQVLSLGIMRGPARIRRRIRVNEAKLGLIQALERTRKVRRVQRQERSKQRAFQPGPPEILVRPPEDAAAYADDMTEDAQSPWLWFAVGSAAILGGVWWAARQDKGPAPREEP